MRFFGNSTFNKWLVAAAAGALSLLPASAFAADASGKFTLTHEVHWGSVVLPAGDYTYSLELRGTPLLLLRGANGEPGFLVMAKTVNTVATESDSLVLQRSGDVWFVSEMVIGAVGEELSFGAPDARALSARNHAATDKLASLSHR